LLVLGGVTFALACSHQTVPPATGDVYPCVPDHTGNAGGDYGNWQTWWTWLKTKYGSQWAASLKVKYGAGLDKYVQSRYETTSTSNYFGSTHHGEDEDCDPEKPGCGPDKTNGVAGGSGYHDGQPPKSDGRGDCPDTCKSSGSAKTYTTSTHGGTTGGDCQDDCKSSGSSKTSYSSSTYGGTKGSDGGGKCDPPTADTGSCGSVKTTSGQISGSSNPKGNSTRTKFEWGLTPAFGMETDLVSVGSGPSDQSVSEDLTDLAPGTKYYYRVIATSSRGTTNGSTRSFTTAPVQKPTAVTGGAGSIGKSAATVSGTVNAGGGTTTYAFEYGKTSSLGSRTGSGPAGSGTSNASVSQTLSGLSSNTKYYYRVVASNSQGTSSGAVGSFTTSR
jgi:hypothetical protein